MMCRRNVLKKAAMLMTVMCVLLMFTGTAKAVEDIFSVNFYGYGKAGALLWDQEDWRLTVTLEAGQYAGVGAWNTDVWYNYNGTSSMQITSTLGSTSTIKVDKVRNYSPYYWTAKRTTLLGDGNADMMDGHGRGTEDPYDGSLIFDFTVSSIPFDYYDVIIYLGTDSANSGNDVATIVFNSAQQAFTVMDELFDGTFTEFVDDSTPCNYIVYEGVSGSSFSVQIWGDDFNHIGPRGVQIMESEASPPGQPTSPGPANGASYVTANVDLSWTAGLFSTSSNVYFGTDPTPDSSEFKGNQTAVTYDPGTMITSTYYWRIDSVNVAGTTTGQVWSFTVEPPAKVVGPGPFDTAQGIDVDADLSWVTSPGAESYDVYFGTDPTPDSGEFKGNQTAITYSLSTLSANTTYYWRIDAINTLGTTTGDVYSFTTMPSPVTGRNTFLVPVPATGASWKDLAFLAAVPASAAINTGGPSVIAVEGTQPSQVTEYLTLYNPANTYEINPNSTLDAVSCYLAQTHWTTTTSVVLANDSNYAGALAASALAGRLEVPLLFFNSSTGLSSSALSVIDNDLQCSTALTVNGNSTVTTQLTGIGVSQTSLANDKAIITWMQNNGYPVEYLAVCNTNDRTMSDYAPKGSLAAALLAAERNGAVAAMNYSTEWNLPFLRTSTTTTKPAGLPSNTEPPRKYFDPLDLNYDLGSCTVNGQTYDWVVVRMTDGDRFDAAFIDFNDDGDFADSGEYCPRTCELTINGKRYTFGVNSAQPNPYAWGELRFTYPSDDKFKEDLQGYHDQIGHYPKYMALVGVLQVLPAAHALSYDLGWCDYVMNDHYYADVDNDPLYDIAIGRIVGEDVTDVTLNASRALTYNDLLYRPASNHVFHQCTEEFEDSMYCDTRKLENCGFIIDEWLEMADYDYKIYGIFSQDEHGWPFGIARDEFLNNSDWTVCFIEGTGCNMASLDMYYDAAYDWKDTNAVVLTREGTVCFHAWCRGTGSGKEISRSNFFTAILEGATTGEAHQYALNAMAAKDENNIKSYDLNANMMYGDPALTLYKPTGPTYAPANVTVNGNILTVHAPGTYWVDYIDSKSKYVYSAPGLAGFISEPQDGTFFATYTTGLGISNMTQESGVPIPLGWITLRESQNYVIDEHWDATRTIYWRVRFEEFNESTGTFTQTISDIDYTLTTYTPDTTPPTPNPATFASAPTAVSSSEITMTATIGSDATPPVQYYFDETSGNPGGSDSGWVTNRVYNDTGLSASTQYTYTVKMRDSAPTPNVGTASSPASATTPALQFVAAGAVSSGTGTISPALPTGRAVNDILLLFVETANQAVSISNQNGGTWAEVTGSPQGTGTAGGTSATRLTVFWSRYNGTQGAPTVSDSGNHQAARMVAIRGAVSSGNPWNITAGGVDATSDTSASIPGATTTVINTLVVVATAGSLPDANGTAQFSAWTNANLTSLTERTDNSVSAGNGGSLGIATGFKATAGAYGNTAATHVNSAVKGMISIAIRP
jgi:hypothetical protein